MSTSRTSESGRSVSRWKEVICCSTPSSSRRTSSARERRDEAALLVHDRTAARSSGRCRCARPLRPRARRSERGVGVGVRAGGRGVWSALRAGVGLCVTRLRARERAGAGRATDDVAAAAREDIFGAAMTEVEVISPLGVLRIAHGAGARGRPRRRPPGSGARSRPRARRARAHARRAARRRVRSRR